MATKSHFSGWLPVALPMVSAWLAAGSWMVWCARGLRHLVGREASASFLLSPLAFALLISLCQESSASTLILGGNNGNVYEYDPATGSIESIAHYGASVESLALGRGSNILYVGQNTGVISVFDMATKSYVSDFASTNGIVQSLALGLNGTTLVVGNNRGEIALFDVATKGYLGGIGLGGIVNALAVTPDGRMLFAGGNNGRVSFYDLATQSHIAEFATNQGGVESLALSGAGDILFVGLNNGGAIQYNVSTGTILSPTYYTNSTPTSLAFDAESSSLLAGTNTGRVIRFGALNSPSMTDVTGIPAVVNAMIVTSPAPEPETYAMLLTGLGMIGAILRRRKT